MRPQDKAHLAPVSIRYHRYQVSLMSEQVTPSVAGVEQFGKPLTVGLPRTPTTPTTPTPTVRGQALGPIPEATGRSQHGRSEARETPECPPRPSGVQGGEAPWSGVQGGEAPFAWPSDVSGTPHPTPGRPDRTATPGPASPAEPGRTAPAPAPGPRTTECRDRNASWRSFIATWSIALTTTIGAASTPCRYRSPIAKWVQVRGRNVGGLQLLDRAPGRDLPHPPPPLGADVPGIPAAPCCRRGPAGRSASRPSHQVVGPGVIERGDQQHHRDSPRNEIPPEVQPATRAARHRHGAHPRQDLDPRKRSRGR